MSTKTQLDGRPQGQSADALDRHGEGLWQNRGRKLMAIVEFAVTECVEPGPDVQKDRKVRLGVINCEVGAGDQEHLLRSAQRALHLQRTASGTLTEDGDLQYAQAVLDSLDDHVDATEAVRLRVALDWLGAQIATLSRNNRHDDGHLRRELKKLAEITRRALSGEQLRLDVDTEAKAALVAAEARVAQEALDALDEAAARLTEDVPDPAGALS